MNHPPFRSAPSRQPGTDISRREEQPTAGWKQFRNITLPQLRPTSAAVLLLLLINAFQAFDEFYNILSSFGTYPPYARPPLVYLYYTALGQGQDFGHGSAGALILTAMIALVAVLFGRLLRADD